MSNSINCCQTSVASEVNEVIDSEVEEIYNAIVPKKDRLRTDKPNALKKLESFIQKHRKDKVGIADRLRTFRRKNETEDSMDSLLHASALQHKDSAIIQLLMKYCPDLINVKRTGSCSGQTGLHITIAKEKIHATALILNHLSIANKEKVLSARATGSNFANTIMMGETALSVAVLTFNTDIVDLLLDHEACVDEVNSQGDTIIHTLIKYTALEKSHIPKAILMLKHLKTRKLFHEFKKLWSQENQDRLTPLKLSVKEGLIEIVQFILNMKDIYCFQSQKDGSFDSRRYDITEIDPAAQHIYSKRLEKDENTEKAMSRLTRLGRNIRRLFWDRPPPSVIEMMSDLHWKDVQEIVDVEIIKMIVLKRWERSFSFVMYIILSGNEAIVEFSTFENTTLTMFGYMLGLKDLDLLKEVDSDSQRLVAGIYVLFIITTYIILINSLIAMMSSTSQATAGERDMMTLLQQSSVSLFLDGVTFRRSVLHDTAKFPGAEPNRFYMLAKIEEIGQVMSQKFSKENFTLKDVRQEFAKMYKRLDKRIPFQNVETFKEEYVDKETQYEAPEADKEEADMNGVLEIYNLG